MSSRSPSPIESSHRRHKHKKKHKSHKIHETEVKQTCSMCGLYACHRGFDCIHAFKSMCEHDLLTFIIDVPQETGSHHKKDRSPVRKQRKERRRRHSSSCSPEEGRRRIKQEPPDHPHERHKKPERPSPVRDQHERRINTERSSPERDRHDRRTKTERPSPDRDRHEGRIKRERPSQDRESHERIVKQERQHGEREHPRHRGRNQDDGQRRRENRQPRERPGQTRVKQEPEENFAFGGGDESDEKAKDKDKPDFKLSGKLTEDSNTFRGVVIKYNEPPEARKPKRRWRLYPFKGEESLPILHIHRQSAFLLGRDRKVADIPVDHPSCSKQHAVLQFRLVEYKRPDETTGRRVRPYIIDLGSANGTFVNNNKIDHQRYVELIEKDVMKFGFSSREYVILHDNVDTAELDEEDI